MWPAEPVFCFVNAHPQIKEVLNYDDPTSCHRAGPGRPPCGRPGRPYFHAGNPLSGLPDRSGGRSQGHPPDTRPPHPPHGGPCHLLRLHPQCADIPAPYHRTAGHAAGSRRHRHSGHSGRYLCPACPTQVLCPDWSRSYRRALRQPHRLSLQPQCVQQKSLLGAGLAGYPHHGAVDRRHHQRRQPHRRPGRPAACPPSAP